MNHIVKWVEGLQGHFQPDVGGLFEVYLQQFKEIFKDYRGSADTAFSLTEMMDDEGGPGSFCYQIGWTVSRGGLRGLVPSLKAPLLASDYEKQMAAAYLIANAADYICQPFAPLFGGGNAPERRPITHFVDEDDIGLAAEAEKRKAEGDQKKTTERILVVTGSLPSDPAGEPIEKFKENTVYKLRIRIAEPIPRGNLTVGLVDIPEQPEGGLATHWIVTSKTVEFLAIASTGTIAKRGDAFFAEFDMLIPATGDSPTIELLVRTVTVPGVIDITLLAYGEEYRKAAVRLEPDAQVITDVICTRPEHLNLGTTHEWTTPGAHFKLTVFGQKVYVSTVGVMRDDPGWFDWCANKGNLDGPIKQVRRALDAYRVAAGALLNALDFGDMARRLQSKVWMDYPRSWEFAEDESALAPIHPSCGESKELRLLADAGYSLYDSCFPTGSRLRKFVESLKPGSRLDFVWTGSGGDWVSHVPWALMYMAPIPPGAIADCGRFFGLRFRIEAKAWEPQAPSAALGDPNEVNALHLLYWGDDQTDEVALQSSWQRTVFGKWDRQFFVPADSALDRK